MFVKLMSLLLLCLHFSHVQAIQIEASIKPLAQLIEPLLIAGDSVGVLVRSGASPHDYALKVSDRQRLENANLVVWGGPLLERFLVKALADKKSTQVLELAQLSRLQSPSVGIDRVAANLNEDQHEHEHEHGDSDPHFWLNPINAKIIAETVSERLVTLNPKKSQQYKQRLSLFVEQLDHLDQVLSQQLQPVNTVGFAVYHRAYDHFVSRYQLNQLAYITVSPEQQPGARHLYQLREKLAGRAECVFVERGQHLGAASALAADLELRTATVDPLGVDTDSYIELLSTIGDAFVGCLNTPDYQAGE